MTSTKNNDHTLVPVDRSGAFDRDAILEMMNYDFHGGELDNVVGPEAEFFVCRVGEDGQLHTITAEDADSLVAEVWNRCGKQLSREAIYDHVELDFSPISLSRFTSDIQDCQKLIQSLFYAAENLGMRVVPANHPPHIRQIDTQKGINGILNNLDTRPRIQALINAGIEIFSEALPNFANGASAIHISTAPESKEHFYNELRRANYLAPIEMVVTSCCFPYNNGMQDMRGRNHRHDAINAFRDTHRRTGIDPLFFTAPDGETFLRDYIERILYSPMIAYYPDYESDEKPITDLGATKKHPKCFADLPRELQTVANFQLAASCFWYHTKIADLPINTDNGRPHKRLERRVYNSGTWQLSASNLEVALINWDSNCAEDIDQLLEEFGYHRDGPANHPESGDLLQQAMERAQEVGASKGLDFQFGREPEQTAQAFEKQRIRILKKYARKYEREYDMPGLTDLLAPREYIAEHNRPDTLVLNELCQKADDVAQIIEQYNIENVTNPTKSLGMLLRDGELPSLDNKRGRQPSQRPAPGITPGGS